MQVLFHLTGIAVLFMLGLGSDFYIASRLIAPKLQRKGSVIYMAVHAFLLLVLTAIGCIATFGGMQESIPVLVWVMFAFMLMYIPKLCYVAFSWVDLLRRPHGKWGGYIGWVVGALSLIIMVGSVFNRYRIQLTETTIVSDRLPRSFDGFRVVQISDFHLETLYSLHFAQRVVNAINDLQPHLILYTGDMVNRRATELAHYSDIFSQLKASHGIFSVMGNHDYGDFVRWNSHAERQGNIDQLHEIKESMGWQMLDNASQYIYCQEDSIAVIGVENWGEPPFPQYGNLSEAYPALQDSTFKILLSHNPRHWRAEVLPSSNVDLTLSGHTHALQMTIGNFSPVVFRYPEWGGLYSEGNQHLYVNIGMGCTMFPTRLGATPEITLITLTSSK